MSDLDMLDEARMEALESAAKALLLPPDGGEADWLGRLDKVLGDLRGLRKTVLDELPGPVTGKDYRIAEGRSASRSYNTAALLKAFSEKSWDLADLIREGAVRLSWRWTELRKAANLADVSLSIASHEVDDVGDIDGEAIGEVWKSQYRVEGI